MGKTKTKAAAVQPEEDKQHVGGSQSTSGDAGATGDRVGGDKPSGVPSGGDSSRESGGQSGASLGGEPGSGKPSGESGAGGRPGGGIDKADLLARIKRKNTDKQLPVGNDESGASGGNRGADGNGHVGSDGGNAGNHGIVPGADSSDKQRGGRRDHSGSGSRQTPSGNDSQGRVTDKPKGIDLKGIAGLPKVPPVPRRQIDTNPITEKEGKELLPQIVSALQQVFKYADLGITHTNAERAEAYIWQTIDPEDCKAIAELLIDAGKKNRLIATGVRRVAMSYKLLQVGIITIPRFIESYRHYADHGGFQVFGGGRGNHAPIPIKREIVSSGQGAAASAGS